MSLFKSNYGFVLTDQRVFSADELQPLQAVADQAQQLSERLAQQATLEEEARNNAQQLGHEQGLVSGKSEAAEQLTIAIRALHDEHSKAVLDLQAAAANLAVDIVRKIAGQIRSDDWLTAQAQCAAEDLTEPSLMKLRVHPSQVEAVKARLEALPASRIKQVVADDFLPLSGCTLETPRGQINIDLDTQLNNILELLKEDASTLQTADDVVTRKNLDD